MADPVNTSGSRRQTNPDRTGEMKGPSTPLWDVRSSEDYGVGIMERNAAGK